MKRKQIILISICIIAFVVLLISWNRLFTHHQPVTDSAGLIGMQTSNAPWNAGTPGLLERLKALGLPALTSEGTKLHIHQHLDLVIGGAAVTVPAGIGINETDGFISPIHTHDTTGIIHVESDVVRDFTLGQFFDIWGVRFTDTCIGGYCTDAANQLRVYSNGNLVSGDPRNLILAAHQEIMIVYGTTTPAIIQSYTFPSGY